MPKPKTSRKTGRWQSLDSLIPPTLHQAYAIHQSMDKPRGFGTTDPTSHNYILLSSKWRRLVGMLAMRKITLLRWFFNCWYRRGLSYVEKDVFLTLVEDFSKTSAEFWILNFLLRTQPIENESYLQWCDRGWKGGFRVPYAEWDLLDLRYQLEQAGRRLLMTQRAVAGLSLNRNFLRRLGILLCPIHRKSEGIKCKRRRKRGHNDHGSLPRNAALAKAEQEGSEEEFQRSLSSRLLTWLKVVLPP